MSVGMIAVAAYAAMPNRHAVAGRAPEIEAQRYFANCSAARAAGAAPIYAGQPGYREEMDGDGDGDGIACEPHRRW